MVRLSALRRSCLLLSEQTSLFWPAPVLLGFRTVPVGIKDIRLLPTSLQARVRDCLSSDLLVLPTLVPNFLLFLPYGNHQRMRRETIALLDERKGTPIP